MPNLLKHFVRNWNVTHRTNAMNSPAIETEQYFRRQGRFELGPLDWTVPTGSVYALVGPNGAGKSTLLDLLMGMGRAHGGRARIFGMDLDNEEVAIKRRVAYVSPELNYQAWGRVGRAIDFVSGFYPDWDSKRCERLEQEFQLDRSDKISTLSFGVKTKLALVIALARSADLYLLDEPTTGLDALAKNTLFSELLEVMKSEKKTIVISSHQLTDLERFADHVGILNEGKLLVSGRMDQVIQRYNEVELEWAPNTACPLPGAKLLSRQGKRARLLVKGNPEDAGTRFESIPGFIAATPMTLEEIFLGLVSPAAGLESDKRL